MTRLVEEHLHQVCEWELIVEDDGSGSIRVERVGGDFIVEDDGSGSVTYTSVTGRVSVPDDD